MLKTVLSSVAAAVVLGTVMAHPVAASPHHKSQQQPLVRIPNGWPKKLAIPRYSVSASVESLAFNRPADVHAPYRWGDVAWYDLSVKPGVQGHAVIFGHLDSTCCPAVFYHLRDMKAGDTVSINYKTGKPLTFRMIWSHVYWNNQLPTKFIFGPSTQRGLVLMTCTGVFHRDGTGYDHKYVVYLRLVLPNGKLG